MHLKSDLSFRFTIIHLYITAKYNHSAEILLCGEGEKATLNSKVNDSTQVALLFYFWHAEW
jgi:hypothetical protein